MYFVLILKNQVRYIISGELCTVYSKPFTTGFLTGRVVYYYMQMLFTKILLNFQMCPMLRNGRRDLYTV